MTPTAGGTARGSGSDEGFGSEDGRRLFEEHVRLAERLARRYSFGAGVDDDLRQVAQIALLLACRRFDPERGSFVRFATVTIAGELKKHLRSSGWGVRVPRALQEDSITVANAIDRLTSRLGRNPEVGEVAEHTGFERERVVEAVRARQARFSTSVEGAGVDVADHGDEAVRAELWVALDRLHDDERRLVHHRLVDGLTQAEIGRLLGISQPQVHRRLGAVMAKLRDELEAP